MVVALEQAVRARDEAWTTERELAAINAEVTHALLLTTLKVNGAKGVGKPIRFPRPWDPKPKVLSATAFMERVKGGDRG